MTQSELDALDSAGLTLPPSRAVRDKILSNLRTALHDKTVVCSSCNCFAKKSSTEALPFGRLPKALFSVLRAPSGLESQAPHLSPLLLAQYCLGSSFPPSVASSFQNILLAPQGVEHHDSGCTAQLPCDCVPKLLLCASCLHAIRKKTVPKFSIANGNYIGWATGLARTINYGSRVLMRPVQHFGRLINIESVQSPMGGTRMTGHDYATLLDVPAVFRSVPISPQMAPTRILVTSPFASPEATAKRAERIRGDNDYIMQVAAQRELILQWDQNENQVMNDFVKDMSILNSLPDGFASPDMLQVRSALVDPHDTAPHTGGPSLQHSDADLADVVAMSCTVSLGASAAASEGNRPLGPLRASRPPAPPTPNQGPLAAPHPASASQEINRLIPRQLDFL